MSRTRGRLILSCFLLLFAYSIFGIYALSLRFAFDFPLELYWLSFVLAFVPVLFEAVPETSNPKLRLFYLLCFSLLLHLQFAVVENTPLISSPDAVADYRLTDKIIADSEWVPFKPVEWSFASEYIYYPGTNFLYATLSLLAGIPLLTVVKYLFIIKALVVPILAERFFRSFFNQRVAYLAAGLFLVSPGAILFPHKETFAAIFLFLGLYAITKAARNRRYVLIGFVILPILILTHHFTSYIFLGILASLFLATHFHKRKNTLRVSSQFFLLYLTLFFAWVAFIAWTVFLAHQTLIFELVLSYILPGKLLLSEALGLYILSERIMVWTGFGIAAVSSVIGFLIYIRDRKVFSSSFFFIVLFLGLLLAIGSVFRFTPSSVDVQIIVSHRVFEFGYIAVGALSAVFFVRALQSRKRLALKVILVGAIGAMIALGPMVGALNPRSYVKISDVISFETISLNKWISESVESNEYAIGDNIVTLILVYGNFSSVSSREFFTGQDMSLDWKPHDMRSEAAYVITYVYMTDFYGTNAARFDNSPLFHHIYTSGILNMYGISKHTSL